MADNPHRQSSFFGGTVFGASSSETPTKPAATEGAVPWDPAWEEPRCVRMFPFQNRGVGVQAKIYGTRLVDPSPRYYLTDTDIEVLRLWIPDFEPGKKGYVSKTEGILLTKAKMSPEQVRQISFPQMVSVLNILEKSESLPVVPIDMLVTLSQVAPLTGLEKRTLERYLKDEKLPPPDFRGGGGRASKWYWSRIRPALNGLINRILPDQFPGARIV